VYEVVVYPEAADQIAELPVAALADYARVLDAIEVAPWNGPPHNERNPGGAVRRWSFGPDAAGQVLYLVLDEQREVHVLRVLWLELG
jgi:hypothetical protein